MIINYGTLPLKMLLTLLRLNYRKCHLETSRFTVLKDSKIMMILLVLAEFVYINFFVVIIFTVTFFDEINMYI